MISIAIVDSGPLLASTNAADPQHGSCLEALQSPEYQLVIPALCIAEVTYLLGRREGPFAESAFLRGLEHFDVQAPMPSEWLRVADLVEQYEAMRLGGTDATVISLAERFKTDIILTLDRRHFGAIRPIHCDAFRLLP